MSKLDTVLTAIWGGPGTMLLAENKNGDPSWSWKKAVGITVPTSTLYHHMTRARNLLPTLSGRHGRCLKTLREARTWLPGPKEAPERPRSVAPLSAKEYQGRQGQRLVKKRRRSANQRRIPPDMGSCQLPTLTSYRGWRSQQRPEAG